MGVDCAEATEEAVPIADEEEGVEVRLLVAAGADETTESSSLLALSSL